MNKQEIFNKAVGGVIAQGELAKQWDGVKSCFYRTRGGAKCAVGQLVDTETAKLWDGMDRSSILDVPHDTIPEELREHIDLLNCLQELHDEAEDLAHFTHLAKHFARQEGLAWGQWETQQ